MYCPLSCLHSSQLSAVGRWMDLYTFMFRPVCTCLEQHWGRCRREVEGLEEMLLWVVLRGIALDHNSLCSTLFTNEQHCLFLPRYYVHQEGGAHIVHIGYQYGGVLRNLVWGVTVLLYSGRPVYPLPCLLHPILEDGLPRLYWRQVQSSLCIQDIKHLGKDHSLTICTTNSSILALSSSSRRAPTLHMREKT